MATIIEEFAIERGIKSLFNFTRVDNLPSILTEGLLTREACALAGIDPAINDLHRYDGTGAISATISYPNYRMAVGDGQGAGWTKAGWWGSFRIASSVLRDQSDDGASRRSMHQKIRAS